MSELRSDKLTKNITNLVLELLIIPQYRCIQLVSSANLKLANSF